MRGINNKLSLFTILLVLASVGIALALFVHSNTTKISDALAEEVLQQQRDVAVLLHEYDRLVLAVETERLSEGEQIEETIEAALTRTENQLVAMRFNYSFERLDGAATAHAYVKPVLEDIRQWITAGIPGVEKSRQDIVSISSGRITARTEGLRSIAAETDEVASELINTQTNYLSRFGTSLIFLLAAFAMFAAGIASLLTRQRDLQSRIVSDQQQHVRRIRDFADTGADWFWEINSDMRLRWLSGSLLSGSMQHKKSGADSSLPPFEYEVDDSEWPVQLLRTHCKWHPAI